MDSGSSSWMMKLRERLAARERASLLRVLLEGGAAGFIDLGTNDYLGLSRHPRVIARVREAAERYGVGAGASRVVLRGAELQREAEDAVVRYKRGTGSADRGLLLATGFAANMAVLGGLVQRGDLILLDKLAHASLIDGARLACATVEGARMRTFAHNDVGRAREVAHKHLERERGGTVFFVSEMVFSMDGDLCPIDDLCALRDELGGRGCLVIDEAHSTGVLEAGIARGADVVVVTASKGLGTLGGMVIGPGVVIESVVNFARAFVYSTAPPPTQAAGVLGAIEVLEGEPRHRARLIEVTERVRAGLREAGWDVEPYEVHPTPIVPLMVGSSENALGLAGHLRERGILAPAIRWPSVAEGAARVRVSLRADLGDGEVERILGVLAGDGALGWREWENNG